MVSPKLGREAPRIQAVRGGGTPLGSSASLQAGGYYIPAGWGDTIFPNPHINFKNVGPHLGCKNSNLFFFGGGGNLSQ